MDTHKICFSCNRKYSFERFAALPLHSFQPFGVAILEVRRCTCTVLIGVEKEITRNDVAVIPAYNTHVRFTGDKRRI